MLVSEEVKVESAKGAAKLCQYVIKEALYPASFPPEETKFEFYLSKKKREAVKVLRYKAVRTRLINLWFVQKKHLVIDYFCDIYGYDKEKLCKAIIKRNQIPFNYKPLVLEIIESMTKRKSPSHLIDQDSGSPKREGSNDEAYPEDDSAEASSPEEFSEDSSVETSSLGVSSVEVSPSVGGSSNEKDIKENKIMGLIKKLFNR